MPALKLDRWNLAIGDGCPLVVMGHGAGRLEGERGLGVAVGAGCSEDQGGRKGHREISTEKSDCA